FACGGKGRTNRGTKFDPAVGAVTESPDDLSRTVRTPRHWLSLRGDVVATRPSVRGALETYLPVGNEKQEGCPRWRRPSQWQCPPSHRRQQRPPATDWVAVAALQRVWPPNNR